jgi:lysophospholipase L1-like esterase
MLRKIMPVIVLSATLTPGTARAAGAVPIPPVMAALGDSISSGFNACGWYVSCRSRSWSTGDDPVVDSQYLRLLARGPVIRGHNLNYAEPRAASEGLAAQAARAVAHGASYVTILIGANDACRGGEADMTPVRAFRRNIDDAMAVLASARAPVRVFVASVPDLMRLWRLGKDDLLARTFWAVGRLCRAMLARPSSTAKADRARRERVRARIMDYNDQLAAACRAYGAGCRYDGGAVFRFPFTLKMISKWDYFHPNEAGQRALAAATFKAGFAWEEQR